MSSTRTSPRSAPAQLQPTDLLPVEVYDRLRTDYRRWVIELKRRRRVEVAATVSLLFESRETVLSQIQEVVWMERPLRAERIAEELREYERLLPGAAELTATLMFHGGACGDGQALARRLCAGEGHAVFLQLGEQTLDALPLTPHDDPTCPVQYLYFTLDPAAISALRDRQVRAALGIQYCGAVHSITLPAETREELARDFEPSVASRSAEIRIPERQSPLALALSL